MKNALRFLKNYRREILIGLALAALVWSVFGQAVRFDFTNYDDTSYVWGEPRVLQGLTWKGAAWAFTSVHSSNWHPLTSLSLMLDATLFGPGPAGFHFTNVLLHSLAAGALFLALRALTGSVWRSALVAALFAVHPLRAESVAWISGRKDVLSGLFFMLTLQAYAGYARRPFSLGRYLGVAALFACGLMSKPMLVTLPCVLLLLDFWPLGRFGCQGSGDRDQRSEAGGRRAESRGGWKRAVLEKIPLLLVVAAAAGVTMLVQEKAITSETDLPFLFRAANAVRSYGIYLLQTFRPAGLVPLYPHPVYNISMPQAAGAALLLAAVSGLALWQWKRRPWLLTGWLWYLGMLVPASGLFVQVGVQAHADRYTYLPQIGVLIMLVWTAAGWRAVQRLRTAEKAAAAAAVTAALAAAAVVQAGIWRDSPTLWKHTLAHTQNNFVAQLNLGMGLYQKGRIEETLPEFRKTIALNPTHWKPHYNLGYCLLQLGRFDEAADSLREALRLSPQRTPETLYYLGVALTGAQRPDEALKAFDEAVRLDPGYAEGHNARGVALMHLGRFPEAAVCFREALRLDPRPEQTRRNLEAALAGRSLAPPASAPHDAAANRLRELLARLRTALAQQPDSPVALNNLAWLLATAPDEAVRDGNEAVRLAERACELSGGSHPGLLDTLAAAYAEAGRFDEAQTTARRAADLARSAGDEEQARAIEAHLEIYRQGLPLRQ